MEKKKITKKEVMDAKIGASNMLETINDTAASFNGDSVLHVFFDENTESVS